MSTTTLAGVFLKPLVTALLLVATATIANAQDNLGCMMLSVNDPPAVVTSKAKSFALLMTDAMTVMNYGMTTALLTGDPDHDFAAMMIPQYQGAIDMAKVELLYGKNPLLRRLAQEIIVTHESEIALLRKEMQKQPAPPPKPKEKP